MPRDMAAALPGPEYTNPDSTPPAEEKATEPTVPKDVKEPKPPEPPVEDSKEEPEQPKGSKTPVDNLYAALKEERDKRKRMEERLKALEESTPSEETVEPEEEPEEDSDLRKRVKELELDKLISKHLELDGKRDDLEAFMEEHSNLTQDQAVDLFRVRHGLVATQPERKGLEKVVAGPKTASPPRWTLDQIEELRLKNFREYNQRMKNGEFDEALQGWKIG